MLYFENDYSEGAHPEILSRLVETNFIKQTGYGSDTFTESAKAKIKAEIKCPEAEIYFLTGGTQTNKVVISSLIRSYEGVISACSGHISLHEAGAIESTGHKVITTAHRDGKIIPEVLKKELEIFYEDETHLHMVQPGMVYISHPTEYGTLYSKEELSLLYSICKEYDLPLFMDGARLGYALASDESDLTLADIAKYTDVFYIGGTKVGALCGEAVVFTKNNCPDFFLTHIKQSGALLAKGRLNGVQFDTLFTDGLYLTISRHAIECAEKLKEIFREKNYPFFIDSPTNQIFIILENGHLKRLSENVRFSYWEKYDEDHTVVRFATSWATDYKDIEALKELL